MGPTPRARTDRKLQAVHQFHDRIYIETQGMRRNLMETFGGSCMFFRARAARVQFHIGARSWRRGYYSGVEMVDIKVKPHLDLTKESVRRQLLQKLQTVSLHAVIFSPPCSTFSRAPWSNRKGPCCEVICSSEGSSSVDVA